MPQSAIVQKVIGQEDFNKPVLPPRKLKSRAKTPVTAADVEKGLSFIESPIPKNKILSATLKRNKSGLRRFFPQYDIFLE